MNRNGSDLSSFVLLLLIFLGFIQFYFYTKAVGKGTVEIVGFWVSDNYAYPVLREF